MVGRSRKCIYHSCENRTLASKLFETIVNECNPPGDASCPRAQPCSRKNPYISRYLNTELLPSLYSRENDDGYVCEEWWESIQSGVYLSDRFFFLSLSRFCLCLQWSRAYNAFPKSRDCGLPSFTRKSWQCWLRKRTLSRLSSLIGDRFLRTRTSLTRGVIAKNALRNSKNSNEMKPDNAKLNVAKRFKSDCKIVLSEHEKF